MRTYSSLISLVHVVDTFKSLLNEVMNNLTIKWPKNYVPIFFNVLSNLTFLNFMFKVIFTFYFYFGVLNLPFHILVKRLGILTINKKERLTKNGL